MFNVETKKGKIRIYFRHYQGIGLAPNGCKIKGQTLCVFELNDNIVCTGASFCSVHDNFNRDTGRKIALERASDTFFWSRRDYDDHIKVADAYINRK